MMKYIGINIIIDHTINPKKLGIEILFSSAIDLTMKLGALPIYVNAPINTAPIDIANKVSGITFIRYSDAEISKELLPAILKNTR